MRIIETKAYQYAELSDKAKEKARDWYRNASAGDSYWSESVIEDAATVAGFLGVTLRTHDVPLHGGGTRRDPCIFFSGFWSQGDGACFEGSWSAKDVNLAALKGYAPTDKTLTQICTALADIAAEYPDASATIKHSGHYYHSGCMDVEAYSGIYADDDDNETPSAQDRDNAFPDNEVRGELRRFADWIYRQLQAGYEYQNSDEQVAETIIVNEYEFTENGERI
jgi:hypothetical protein